MNTQTYEYETKRLDHLGIVAGICQRLDLIGMIDGTLPSPMNRKVNCGQAIQAMVLNALGLSGRALYLMPEYMENKPIDMLIGEGLEASDLDGAWWLDEETAVLTVTDDGPHQQSVGPLVLLNVHTGQMTTLSPKVSIYTQPTIGSNQTIVIDVTQDSELWTWQNGRSVFTYSLMQGIGNFLQSIHVIKTGYSGAIWHSEHHREISSQKSLCNSALSLRNSVFLF